VSKTTLFETILIKVCFQSINSTFDIETRLDMVTKLCDVKDIVKLVVENPKQSFPAIMKLASSEDWKEREVAATILVEGSKKRLGEITAEMMLWAEHPDANIRRTASEGLRDIARKKPEVILPVISKLKDDPNIYVKRSVANVLRNAGNYHPEFVLRVCEEWAKGRNAHTAWIIKDGLRKLKAKYSKKVEEIIASSICLTNDPF
jgi:3-methyladenine DNA glycosylase AlkC